MFETKILQNLVKGLDPIHSKTIQLRPGQVFQGTITQLYPGQLAQLQLGSMTLSAQLEAHLEKGSRYWFRVMGGEGIPRLQVLENVPPSSGSNQSPSNAQAVLQQLGVPQGATYERVLQQLQQLNLPFTRSNILEGGQLLQKSSLNQQQSLEVVINMIQRGFPLTTTTFQSLVSMQSNQSMGETMSSLYTQLQSTPQGTAVNQQLQQMLSTILNQADPSRTTGAFHTLLQQLGGNGLTAQQAATVANQIGVIPENQRLPEFFKQFKATILKPENQELLRQIAPQLFQGNQSQTAMQAMEPKALFQAFMNNVRMDQPQGMQMMLQLLNPGGNSANMTNQFQQWLLQQPSDQIREVWSNVQNASKESFFLTNGNGTRDESPLRMLLQQFGLQHEGDLRSMTNQEAQQKVQSLKSLLMQFLQQTSTQTQGAREQAEFLLQRVTGQQLMSSEQHGPIQHTLFQAPVKITDKYQDLTIQWEGQTKNGLIDESHCRIIFYLNLEALNETVVDVQIQNRIMTLTIFNETEKPKSVAERWFPILKEKLSNMDYQLSSIQWKQPLKSETSNQVFSQPGNIYRKDEYGYRGVDVRI
ncbi:hypothetical protein CR203_02775 [Salipaludibacillus neizhouensis]|uniref:Flagellar hook-length control protein-like C-terminal domain-containing protein n=1 Tax=Salipaludibacillus neizhouensis TaxID=885475 RepID=A0A3A9KE06_9BACI|nr:hypothetical protein [Salipaludibacillus neizhouensis]RKL68980.1 hypothetical protein CR203_02775 [Salipaludibacillus neizhouensis]